jgi:hypothetical protein
MQWNGAMQDTHHRRIMYKGMDLRYESETTIRCESHQSSARGVIAILNHS